MQPNEPPLQADGTSVQPKTDHELAVAYERNAICLFGFDTYKHENQKRADALRAERDVLEAELRARGLLDRNGGLPPALQAAAEADPAVVALARANVAFIKARVS